MTKKTKTELLNENQHLQDVIHAHKIAADDFRSKIKDLHAANREAALLITEKDIDINGLQHDLLLRGVTVQEMTNKIKDLELRVRNLRQYRREKLNECSNLEADTVILNERIVEKDKEIKYLKAEKGILSDHFAEKDQEIKQLRACCDEWSLLSDRKDKEFKELCVNSVKWLALSDRKDHEIKQLQQELATSRDYSDKQADVIRNYLKQIADLERRLELSEKFSGNREFYNATEAMGNPLYFQGVK